jgi:hypothetical protein
MPAKLLDQVASLAIPDTDTKVLAACDDVLVVKGKIENSRSVVSESTNGSISCTNVIDDAGRIGGSSYKNFIVILQTEDRRHVMGGK